MNYQTSIEINNILKSISIKPGLYMDFPIWEVTIDEKSFLLRKTDGGWDQSSENGLEPEVLQNIGDAIEYFLRIKEAS